MPNRILREGILTSPRIAKLSWAAEAFYRRLMSVVDDFGRFHAHPMLLRAACYPLQLDKVSDSDIGKWMRETAEAALVRVYPAEDGKRYLELLDFRQQVRATKSKFPQPPTDATQVHSECLADAQHVRTETYSKSETDSETKAGDRAERSQGSRLNLDSLPDEWRSYCLQARPELIPDSVWENFRDYWAGVAGKDGRKADWLATWRGWVRREKGGRVNGANKQEALEASNREIAMRAAREHSETDRAGN